MAARITPEVEAAALNYIKVNRLDKVYKNWLSANGESDFLEKAPGINAYCRALGVEKESLSLAVSCRMSLVHDALTA